MRSSSETRKFSREPSTRDRPWVLPFSKGAVVDTDQTESAEEVGGADVGHVSSVQRGTLPRIRGAGMVEMMVSNSGSRLSLSGRPPSAGWFTEA